MRLVKCRYLSLLVILVHTWKGPPKDNSVWWVHRTGERPLGLVPSTLTWTFLHELSCVIHWSWYIYSNFSKTLQPTLKILLFAHRVFSYSVLLKFGKDKIQDSSYSELEISFCCFNKNVKFYSYKFRYNRTRLRIKNNIHEYYDGEKFDCKSS